MKRTLVFLLSLTVVGAIGLDAYAIFGPRRPPAARQANTTAESAATSASRKSQPRLVDGTYTGESVDTRRGAVQVGITVASGRITAVNILDSPHEYARSASVNAQALPIYQREALAAQSSRIDQVSGATETFKGFTGSLQDAINQAQG